MDLGAEAYARFLAGDDGAMLELVRLYRPGLTFFIGGIVGNADLAEELTQETFVKLCVKRPKNRGGGTFKTWLYAMGRNLALDALRRRNRRAEEPLPPELPAPAAAGDPADAVLRAEDAAAVRRALGGLSTAYRQALTLTYYEGFDVPSLAKILKKNPHAVSALLYRARAALKAQLEQEGFTYENR